MSRKQFSYFLELEMELTDEAVKRTSLVAYVSKLVFVGGS